MGRNIRTGGSRTERDQRTHFENHRRAGAVDRPLFEQLDQGVVVDQQGRSLSTAEKRFDLENPSRIDGRQEHGQNQKNKGCHHTQQPFAEPIRGLNLRIKQKRAAPRWPAGYSRCRGGYPHAAASAAFQKARAPAERPVAPSAIRPDHEPGCCNGSWPENVP
jgi:hypothetical protein